MQGFANPLLVTVRYGLFFIDAVLFTVSHNRFSNDNQDNRKAIVYARNACFELARELGYKYFIELDDDYYYFGHKEPDESSCYIYDLDRMFDIFIEYLENSPITTIAFTQDGDVITL